MRAIDAILSSKWTKVVVFPLCLVPLGILVWQGFHNDLTSNPQQYLEHATGDWVLRFLVITLAITPLRKILHLSALIRFRRMMGLFAFFYLCLHFTTWLWLDRYFSGIFADIAKRPFITVGFTAFVLLIPLAITSTAGWIRRLGGRNWQRLHRLIYVSAVLGVIHFWWLVKSDVHKPLEYALMVGVLLLWRIITWLEKRRQPSAPRKAVSQAVPKSDVSAETI